MPFMLRPVDLEDVFGEDEELLEGWLMAATNQADHVFQGYSGNMYAHSMFGGVDVYTGMRIQEDAEAVLLEEFALQVSGPCVWNVYCTDFKFPQEGSISRIQAVRSKKNGGFTLVNIINADVLPGFLEGTELELQVAAFAVDVDYYETEDDFTNSYPEMEDCKFEEFNGHKLTPAIGSALPINLLVNHNPDSENFEKDNEDDDLVLIVGKVKQAWIQPVKFGDETISQYIVSRIETQFGELDIVHSRDMITDEEAKIIKPGVIVQTTAVISADAAIQEYENGIVKDAKNDIVALAESLQNGRAERLKSILSDDAVYNTVNAENPTVGKEAIINRLNYVHDTTEIKYFSKLATLQDEYEGERCIVLAENEEDNYHNVVRIKVNEDGLITEINVTDDPNLTFSIDVPIFEHEDLLDIEEEE